MSLTLPRATAVNCKFVALPDSLATDDNTLKLYNIDGGGGGGTGDAYTKTESDARYLQLSTATPQTVTQIPVCASGIKFANGNSKLTAPSHASAKEYALPVLSVNAEIMCNTASSRQEFMSGVAVGNGGSARDVYSPIIRGRPSATALNVSYIPELTGTCDFLVTKPANTQTIYQKPLILDYTGGAGSGSALILKGFGSGLGNGLDLVAASSVNGTKHIRFYAAPSAVRGEIYDNGTGICYQGNQVSVMTVSASDAILASVRVAGNVTILAKYNANLYKVWVPALASDNGDFVITNPSTAQTINKDLTIAASLSTQTLKFSATPTASFNTSTNGITAEQETTTGTVPSSSAVCNWTKNYAIPKTDLVTTVTGDSDSKVASEKAVKTYVDSKIPASNNYYTCIYTTWTHPWSGTQELTDIDPNLDGFGIRSFSFRLVGLNSTTVPTSIIRHFISYPNTRYTIRINGTYKPETLTFRVPFKRMYIVETTTDGTVTYCVANTEVSGEDFVNTDFEQLAFQAGGTGLNLVGIKGNHSTSAGGVGEYEVKFLAAPI